MKKMTGDDVFRAICRWPRKDNLSDAQRKAQYRVRMENVRNLSKCAAAEILKMGLWENDLKIPENRKKDMDMIQKDIVRNLPVRPRYTEETINWAVAVMQYLVWQEKSFVDYDQSPNHWAIQGATDTTPGPVLPDPDPNVPTTEWFDRMIRSYYGQDLPDPAPHMSTTEWLTDIVNRYNAQPRTQMDALEKCDVISQDLSNAWNMWRQCPEKGTTWAHWVMLRGYAFRRPFEKGQGLKYMWDYVAALADEDGHGLQQ